jgi:hypothetical protein
MQIRGGAEPLSGFSLEFRGYQTSAFVFQSVFPPPGSGQGTTLGGTPLNKLDYGYGVIWNQAWKAADEGNIRSRDAAITNTILNLYPHNQTDLPKSWEGK